MSNDNSDRKQSEGLKRRDVLLSGSSMLALSALAGNGLTKSAQAQPSTALPGVAQTEIDRTVLPIAEPVHKPITELDARRAKAPPRFEVKAPQGAPNVVIVLLDDMGFGQPSTFGGAIAMPTLDRLANEGLRYNNFNVNALCSPTRVSLLTGRNHHTNNAGAVMEMRRDFQATAECGPTAWLR